MISEPSKSRPTYGPIACSQNGHKSQGSGTYRPHTLTDDAWFILKVCFFVVFLKFSFDFKDTFNLGLCSGFMEVFKCISRSVYMFTSSSCPGRNTTAKLDSLLYYRFRIPGSQVVKAVSAGSPLHPAVYRQVFYPPKAQAQICIPAPKANIF